MTEEGSSGMSIVRFEDVTKRFGDVRAVDKVSIGIEEGEIFGLLGPNGAGKTTVINIIAGLLRVTEGKATVLGLDLATSALAMKRGLGVVPQEIAIYEDLSSLENVKFFASLYGLGGRGLTRAAEEALEFTGLLDKAKALPRGFSGGMKRRLNIACAIAHKPRLIIMDEPTVGIDPQTRNHILHSVRLLNEQGCTIIYTTHYMEEAEEICGRIAIMDHGKVIAEGTRSELTTLITDTSRLSLTISDPGSRLEPERLRAIPGVTGLEIEDNVVRIASAPEVNILAPAIGYLSARGITIRGVQSMEPDLETVFLSLTGRRLRD
jgi:ABC-2 type transport system ATP-binding protein